MVPRKPSKAEQARLDAVRAVAVKTFLEFYSNSSWAHDKLRSGTAALTPETVKFMKDELERRADDAKRDAEMKATLAAEEIAGRIAESGA